MTVFDLLKNAQMNFETFESLFPVTHPVFLMAMSQLDNAVKAVESGKNFEDEIEEK